jgi:hypothetical protein
MSDIREKFEEYRNSTSANIALRNLEQADYKSAYFELFRQGWLSRDDEITALQEENERLKISLGRLNKCAPKWATHIATSRIKGDSEFCAWVEDIKDYVDSDPADDEWVAAYKHAYWTFEALQEQDK